MLHKSDIAAATKKGEEPHINNYFIKIVGEHYQDNPHKVKAMMDKFSMNEKKAFALWLIDCGTGAGGYKEILIKLIKTM